MKAMIQAAMMVTALGLTTIACTKTEADSNLSALDHEEAVEEDCFTKVIAGPTGSDGKLEKVSFAYGSCQGSSKALHFLTDHSTVEIVMDGESYEASLYQDGKALMAKMASGEMQKVGEFSDRAGDAGLTMTAGAEALLAVKSGAEYRNWQKGEDISGKKLKLMIVMR